jgi:high-affinity nickel-transport protein
MDALFLLTLPFGISMPVLSIVGSFGVAGAALALGIRHGIDWDHIAAITDITSTTAASHREPDYEWLTHEPGLLLTDESHHDHAHRDHTHAAPANTERAPVAQSMMARVPVAAGGGGSAAIGIPMGVTRTPAPESQVAAFVRKQKPSLVLGTMYALGHGSVVFVLGLLALLAREFLPAWIDPIMERVVGVTLLFLAAYLFYSVYRFFRSGEEFQIRSRWMLVFAGVRNGFNAVRSRFLGRPHEHVHEAQQYGLKTAYGIGMIHGVGAETGTQVLVITTAAGAGSKTMGVVALGAFLCGLLISNSIVTVMTTIGFVSSRQRQTVYVAAGLFAAIFSLFVGLFFLTRSADLLPNLDQYFHWIGGGGAN